MNPLTQWAAVSTQLAAMRDPPHNMVFEEVTKTCQGNCICAALEPPAICFDAFKYDLPAVSFSSGNYFWFRS